MKALYIFLSCSMLTLLHAVPPPPGFVRPDREVCRLNPVAYKARVAALKAAPFFPTPLSATTAYVLLIRVDFSDQVMQKTKEDAEAFMESMKKFFLENSYGILTVSATVTNRSTGGTAGGQGAYQLPETLEDYAQGICSNYSLLSKDSLAAADPDYLLSSVPSKAGTAFNHIMIYHAGFGAETSNDPGCQSNNIWSVFAPTVPTTALQNEGVRVPFEGDGIAFNGVTVVPEFEAQNIDPLGVICHEYGHQLGLPDLYKTSAESVVGSWSVMDGGIYIGSPVGSNPAYLDPWSKQFLGFSSPQTHTPTDGGTSLSLGFSINSSNAYFRIPILGVEGVDSANEYFLVERRGKPSKTGKTYDDAIPYDSSGEGYLIWHIDDSIASNATRLDNNSINSGLPHFGVDLVEAGGTGAIAQTNGKDSDMFPGSKGKTLFATPHSNAFNGKQSGIALSGFSGSSFFSKKAFATDSVSIARVINFPNPGGTGYTQKTGAAANTVTTIVLNTTRPPQIMELTIHDLSGQLVREVPENSIKANGLATGTNKFIFEYDWDGRNDNGEGVAPGVYLYRFKADDTVVKVGKLVLVN